MGNELSQVHLSGRQIRVLAHPLRIQLLGRLRGEGPATATRLAAALATNTGATSYHLRQLAEAGLVVEEERPGTGRQRWWRAAHEMSSWRRSYYADDPDATAAAEWLEAFQVNRFVEKAETWRRGQAAEPPEWRDAGELSDYLLTLDHTQVGALMAEINAVVERYARLEPGPGARAVTLYLAALPKVADEGLDGSEGPDASKAAHDGPEAAHDGPEAAHDGPEAAHDGPEAAHDRPKTAYAGLEAGHDEGPGEGEPG